MLYLGRTMRVPNVWPLWGSQKGDVQCVCMSTDLSLSAGARWWRVTETGSCPRKDI